MRRPAIVLLAAVVLAACGSGAGAGGYVKQVNAVQARFHRSLARVQATIDTPTATARQERRALGGLDAAVRRAVGDLRAVTPPGDVAGDHRRLITALRAYVPVIAARRAASGSHSARELLSASASFAAGSQAVNARVQRAIDAINERL